MTTTTTTTIIIFKKKSYFTQIGLFKQQQRASSKEGCYVVVVVVAVAVAVAVYIFYLCKFVTLLRQTQLKFSPRRFTWNDNCIS